METEKKKITDSEVLAEISEEWLDDDTVFRVVAQMGRSYSIHKIYFEDDTTYFIGVEGEYGLALYGSTDLLDVINLMETYVFDEMLYPYEDVEFVIPHISECRNLIN